MKIEPVFVDSFLVTDPRNGNVSPAAADGDDEEMFVPLDGKDEAKVTLEVILDAPAEFMDDALTKLKWSSRSVIAELAESDEVSAGLRRGDLITVLIPGRGQLSFAFEPKLADATPGAEKWDPHFISIDGSGSVLGFSWDDSEYELISINGEFFVQELDGLQRIIAFDPSESSDTVYDTEVPNGYRGIGYSWSSSYLLTTVDDWSYELDFINGLVSSATDAYGNTITYSDTGISAGGETIHIERDSISGRIAWISSDPTGAGPKVAFSYDEATGDLLSVTDQAGRTTYYTYDSDPRSSTTTPRPTTWPIQPSPPPNAR